MLVFIVGGAKSGKSHYAQDVAVRLSDGGKHYYIATMIPVDAEDHRRIEAHLKDREGLGFETLEAPVNLPACLDRADHNATFLLDSTTALFMNEYYPDHKSWVPDETAAERTARDILRFAGQVRNLVVVSDNIYADAFVYDESTEDYRRGLAHIDRAIARHADTVIEMVFGNPVIHKGGAVL